MFGKLFMETHILTELPTFDCYIPEAHIVEKFNDCVRVLRFFFGNKKSPR